MLMEFLPYQELHKIRQVVLQLHQSEDIDLVRISIK